jgi:outer membrane cobalamin receptor
MCKKCIPLIFLLVTAIPLLAISTVKVPQDSLKHWQLPAFRVQAEKPSETIGSVTVKTIGETASKADFNLKETMQDMPGMQITVGTKDESNLHIRGFRKNEVKVFLDGRPLNSGYFGNIDLQNIPVADIQEIQVLKGPVSAQYGANTMGGVVNIITRAPSPDKWFRIGLQAKRNNTNHVELTNSHQFETWNYWLFASREHTDGFVLPADFQPTMYENGQIRNQDIKTQYHLEGKSAITIADFNTLTFTAGVSTFAKKMIPSSLYEGTFRMYKDWLRLETTAMGDFLLTPDLKLITMLAADGGKDTYHEYNDPGYSNLALDSKMKYHTLSGSAQIQQQFSSPGKLQTGYRIEEQFCTRKDNGSYTQWTSSAVTLHHLFAQYEKPLLTPLTMTLGSGFSLFKKENYSKIQSFWEPSGGLYYDFANHATISVAVGKNTAFPTMRQLFSSDKGNPDLLPQTAWKSEITASQPFVLKQMSGKTEISLFYNDARNLIDLQNEKFTNLYQVQSYGGESVIELKPLRGWRFSGTYSYLAYLHDSDYELLETAKNSVELAVQADLPYKLQMAVSSQWRDLRISQDGGMNKHVLPAYWVHNLRFARSFKGFKTTFGLENFTDTYYEEEYGYPAAGMNFNIGLEKEF